jgi:hypothetical protein
VAEAGKQKYSQEQLFITFQKRPCEERKADLDDFAVDIRFTINEFPFYEKQRPTLKGIVSVLKDKFNFCGCLVAQESMTFYANCI